MTIIAIISERLIPLAGMGLLKSWPSKRSWAGLSTSLKFGVTNEAVVLLLHFDLSGEKVELRGKQVWLFLFRIPVFWEGWHAGLGLWVTDNRVTNNRNGAEEWGYWVIIQWDAEDPLTVPELGNG